MHCVSDQTAVRGRDSRRWAYLIPFFGGKLWLLPAGIAWMRVDPRYLPKGRCALIAGHLDDFEGGGIGIGRGEEVVILSDFIDCRLRKKHPPQLCKTKELSMQTTIVQRHRCCLLVI